MINLVGTHEQAPNVFSLDSYLKVNGVDYLNISDYVSEFQAGQDEVIISSIYLPGRSTSGLRSIRQAKGTDYNLLIVGH